jgi:SpoVK/Ycf46/Vps4 family AAA+-type ATPase
MISKMDQEANSEVEEIGFYSSSFQHVWDMLGLLDLLLQRNVISARRGSKDEFRDLYISDEEIDEILEGKKGDDRGLAELGQLIAQCASIIESRKENSLARGIPLRLQALEDRFGLSPFESWVVVIAFAPEMDRKYERLYAYLQDDATRKRPGVSLVLDLLCATQEERAAGREYLQSGGRLMRNDLLRLSEGHEPHSPLTGSLLSASMQLNRHVVDYLLGLNPAARRIAEEGGTIRLDELELPDELRSSAKNLISHIMAGNKYSIILLQGYYGSGKRRLAEAVCNEIGLFCFHIDAADLAADAASFDGSSSLALQAFREARLWGAAVYVQDAEKIFTDEQGGQAGANSGKSALLRVIEEFDGPVFLAGNKSIDLGRRWQGRLFNLNLPIPDYSARKRLWARSLESSEEEVIADLASKFRFTPGQIEDAVAAARNIAVLNGLKAPSLPDLYEGCRSQSKSTLSLLARRIKPRYSWEDIVLPADKIEQLRDIRNHVRHRGLVYSDWGFERKLSLGKGLNALFIGPSGTGKTMAAEVVARDLGIDLYKIDLSSIVSKYIGETEKNLNRIFKEAEQSNAMLFFDEADALFGKRSEVKDSHDRYANIEVSYLLQKMEEHEGIVILASNLGSNIDDAFMRRMNFLIEFPFPEEEYRCRIWQSMMPKEAPVSEDVDYDFLSRRFKIAGGNIRNIIINSAFSAAEDSGIITMKHIVNATSKELIKIGKAYSQSDFGKYCHLIKSH